MVSTRVRGPVRTLTLSFLALAALALAREGLRRVVPDTDTNLWLFNQTLLTGPRLLVVGLLWLLAPRPEGFGKSNRRLIALGAALALLGWLLYFHSNPKPLGWGPFQRVFGTGISAVVGVAEEYLYRGLILGALVALWKPWPASLTTSLLFTAFHFRAQSPDHWPMIFLTGQLLAELRLAGASLWSLALLHAVIDASWFWVGRGPGLPWTPLGLAALAVLFAANVACRAETERARP